MLKLYQSNRLEQLVDLLAAVTSEPLESPLTPETIVVQHPGMGRWLSLQLANRLGICANIHFPLPAGFIWDIFRNQLDNVPEHNRFEPVVLGWRVLGLLEGLENDPLFKPVQSYLQGGDDLKRLGLACRIAEAFDQYLIYRPDWIVAWEQGKSATTGDAWQAELWRQLVLRDAGPHWVRLQQRLHQMLDAGEAASRLPKRVCLFGVPTLSPGYLETIHCLSEQMDVHLFLLNPCVEYWTEIVGEAQKAKMEDEIDGGELFLEVGNPLLASLGRQGRDFFASIIEFDPVALDAFEPPEDDSLLGWLQSEIYHLRDGCGVQKLQLPEDDVSLQFHSCHSPMRELEVLKDQLLDLLQRTPELEPADMLVMIPDIDSYAPYIEAVFSGASAGSTIPYHVADCGINLESPVIAAFFNLLQVGRSRFDANSMLALLEIQSIQRRFGLVADNLGQITRWVEESGVRWGHDDVDRVALGLPATAQNSWQAGLDRLLLGFALPGSGEQMFHGILPYDDVEGVGTAVLGSLHAFTDAVFALKTRLAGNRSVAAWGRELVAMLDEFFASVEHDEGQLQLLRDGIESLCEQACCASFNGAVSVDVLRKQLETQLNGGQGVGRFLSGGVTFCALMPMRSLPHEVICLIGMNDGQFPRQRRAPGFDLIAQQFRFGDRSRRLDDRYLFLETLISARHCLYISYVGQDIRDNSQIPPSVLVDELLDYLDRSYQADIRDILLVRHPLQPYSSRYFLSSDTKLFSYSQEMFEAYQAALHPVQQNSNFIEYPISEPELKWCQVELDQLLRFFTNPTRYLLQKRLSIYLTEQEELLNIREPFELDYFVANDLSQRLVEAKLAGRDMDDMLQLMRAEGGLPHGRLGERIFNQAKGIAVSFAGELQAYDEEPLIKALEIDLRLGEMHLTGWLHGIRATGLFDYSVHKIWDSQLLEFWIRHLVLNVTAPPGVEPASCWLDKDQLYKFKPVEQATEHLSGLLELYWQGLHKPLHFFPKSSLEYMEYRAKDKDAEFCLNKAAIKWRGEYTPRPEWGDPYYALTFPEGNVLDAEFQELSERVFSPLYLHCHRFSI
ncbi:Exodeoxyribonuclease V gamma chain [hydrothermal vent metagenome]|uniref:Exodeoxyribonuclease V gamma chain n=1 Tax=hydrothermal vent metagenome TaxID=652676 RepID=A0A3B1B9G4_9ZZZZ